MMSGKNGSSVTSVKEDAPNCATEAGVSPLARRARGMRPRALCLLPLTLLGVTVASCSQGSVGVAPPVVLGLTSSAAPYYSDDEITLYEAQKQVPLPIRKPTSAEESALGKGIAPFPHAPYLLSSDVTVELHYTLTNVDTPPPTPVADHADDGQRPAGAVARGRERGADLRDDHADHGVLQRNEFAEQHQRDQDGDEPAG